MATLPYTDAFLAERADPAFADELQLFGQFVGSWDLVVTNHRPDGSSETIAAEWHFAWRSAAERSWTFGLRQVEPSASAESSQGGTGSGE